MAEFMLRRRTRCIARAVLGALKETGMIAAEAPMPVIEVEVGVSQVRIRAGKLDSKGETVFLQALMEVFCPLFSPRYVLLGSGQVYAVPKALGARHELADVFHRNWRRCVGGARIFRTNSTQGKTIALSAVARYLANHCRKGPDLTTRWR